MPQTKGPVSGFNYPEIVQNARTMPEEKNGTPSNIIELPPMFQQDNSKNPYIEPTIPPEKVALQMHFNAFSRVLTLWRPWETCGRCIKDVNMEKVELPEDGDYECPHTHAKEYRQIVERGVRGETIITLKDSFNLANGMRCVHIEWLEGDPKRMKEIKEAAENAEKNAVYPPVPPWIREQKK